MNRRRVDLGLRSESVRRANLSTVVRELHRYGALTRSELGARTGLTRSTIRVLTGELAAAGLVEEFSGSSLGSPGRPSAMVRLRSQRAVVLALEISVDSLAAAVVGVGGEVLRRKRIDRPRGAFSVDDTVRDLAGLVADLGGIDHAEGTDEQLVGAAVAFAGIVRRSDNVVSMAPNLGWRDVPLGELLGRALGTPRPIPVANEADLGALAEHRRGAGRSVDNLLYISGEVGIGGGLIAHGRPVEGASGYAGEIGHVPLNPAGATCGCGSIGCWETEAGEHALLARAGFDIHAGRAGVELVIDAAQRGDRAALAAFDHVGTWLGRGLAGLVNILNPELVLLGGLFLRIYPYVEQPLERAVERLALGPSRAIVQIAPASLGVDAPLLGAAELAFDGLLEDPASLTQTGIQSEWRVVA